MNDRANRLLWLASLAAALILTGVPIVAIWQHDGSLVTPAFADDHDGDDDDDDDDGDDDDDDEEDDDEDDYDDDDEEEDSEEDGINAWNRQSRRDHYDAGREILAVNADADAIRSLEADGFVVRDHRTLGSLQVSVSRLTIPQSLNLSTALARARQVMPRASYEPNPVYRLAAGEPATDQVAAVPCAGRECYPFNMMRWPTGPETCGNGLRLGMTDTAVDSNHPALQGRAVYSRQFVPVGAGAEPSSDHGTAVAALLIGNPTTGFAGMLPSAALFAADVFHSDDSGQPQATLADLVEGLDWLAAQDVSVINISMTGPPNRLLEDAVRRLNQRGIAVVAAAGNGGPGASPAFPAAYDEVVSVTAVDQESRAYRMANRGDYIAFASPGVDIWSAAEDGAGRYRTGTSLAAAHVSAAIADIIGRQGTDVTGALGTLRRNVRDLGAPGKDRVFGWGLIQAPAACRG